MEVFIGLEVVGECENLCFVNDWLLGILDNLDLGINIDIHIYMTPLEGYHFWVLMGYLSF